MEILKQIALGLFGILPGNYSGITHIAADTYAVVNDKDTTDGFLLLELSLDPQTGKVRQAAMKEPLGMAQRRNRGEGTSRDCEGIAYCPDTQTLFVSGEADQRVVEYTLEGVPTGRELRVPLLLQQESIRSNQGFEALCYESSSHLLWTVTESTLPQDGTSASLQHKDVRNRLRLTSFALDMQRQAQYAYQMDLPTVPSNKGGYALGVPSLCFLPDGRLLVMEREAYVSPGKLRSFCRIKLYAVQPDKRYRVQDAEPLSSLPDACFLPKTLLADFTTRLRPGRMNFANYEGMCLGPTLEDGRQTLILLADSQGGMGNRLYHLKDYVRVIVLDARQR